MTYSILTTLFSLLLLQICVGQYAPDNSPAVQQLPIYAAKHRNDNITLAENAFGRVYPSLTASLSIQPDQCQYENKYENQHIFLQDRFLFEFLQSVNRERIPERIVHAKGAGAFGYFKVTKDISQYTLAPFLQLNEITRAAIRFSTGTGSVGSADTAIDVKGCGIKFYTKEGIHDLLGFNTECFFAKDPFVTLQIKKARKKNPQTFLPDKSAQWDIFSNRTETTMFNMLFFSDLNFRRSYRYMDWSAINTFKLINRNGKAFYARFHWISNQKGKENYMNLTEAFTLAGTNPNYFVQDLFDSIAKQENPSFTLKIQIMTFKEATELSFNPFDNTKIWYDVDFPKIDVGILILDQNPENYFVDVEQIAFCPGHMVRGIEPNPDIILQSRIFAYSDSQLYRLGTNHAQIPVNSCPFQVNTYQRDGAMNVGRNGGSAPNYYPNSYNGLDENPGTYSESPFHVTGDVYRADVNDGYDFLQPIKYWKQLSVAERNRFIERMALAMSGADKRVLRNAVNNIFYKVDKILGDTLKSLLML